MINSGNLLTDLIYEPLFSHFQSFADQGTLRSSALCCEMEKQNRNKHTLYKISLCGQFVYSTAQAYLQNQCISQDLCAS